MMIVPLPRPLLDLLLVLNIALASLLLMVSIYVPSATRFGTLPTVLLLATLLRLGLNVSSARLILLDADAGRVIRAFGAFVVRGNLVVGAIVFLILVVIQYLVIAKGAERVAEVAARFSLDAMPGRQLGIDADLRAGAVDHSEALRRRAALQRESQLYGAMDGAMKFVKGDAIAAIVIVAISLIGGVIVGVTQHELGFTQALTTYGILSIGEGLVTQLPALLLATAAGLVVTRVPGEQADGNLGRDLGGELLAHPRALAITAVLLLVLALVPGLPALPFLVLGVIVAAVAYAVRNPVAAGAGDRAGAGASAGPHPLPISSMATLALELAPDVAARAGADDGGALLALELPRVTGELMADLGVPLPPVRVRVDPGLAAGAYRVVLAGVPVLKASLDAQAAAADVAPALARAVAEVARRSAPDLVGIQETQALLDALERTHPALVREVVPRSIAPGLLADVLRRLVDEGVSIRDLRGIVQALADAPPGERDGALLAERVRGALRRQLSHQHAADGQLDVLLVDPEIEDAVRSAAARSAAGALLALEPALQEDVLGALRRALASRPGAARPPVVLVPADVRRPLRRLLELERADIAVLSFQELLPDVRTNPVGRIAISAADDREA
ncbi:MAG: FHIPEP family type III secretion protein [Deltaproteobacteria bacterium]|nr:FHIPEP family type III secretion protein [Deltaproteobacteria bacterium]